MFTVALDNFADTKTVLQQASPAHTMPDERTGKFTLVLGA